MTLKKKDFIEIEFTGRVKDGEIFDSNIKEDLEKTDQELKEDPKPFIFCLGEGMFLKGIDDFLIGKDVGTYNIELPYDKAFGKRDPKLIQRMPIKAFREHNLNPIPGFVFNFDGKMGKVLAASGGRVIVDFNNPVAGKDVVYDIKVLRKIEDKNEKVRALTDFFFRKDLKFEIKNNKIIFDVDDQTKSVLGIFRDKFKDLLGLNIEFKGEYKEIKEQKSEISEKNKTETKEKKSTSAKKETKDKLDKTKS